jgi:predicted phosphodiesterase
LRQLGFKSSKADPDVWLRKAKKPNGAFYWEYILCYVDDVLVIGHEPQTTMSSISQYVTFKPGSVQSPTNLRANISQCTVMEGDDTLSGKQVWTMSAQEYIKQAVDEVE